MAFLIHLTENGWQDVSPSYPLPVYQAGSAANAVNRSSYSGTVNANSSATMHGGTAGTPTVVGAAGARFVMVVLQHKMATGASATTNNLRVRRRWVASDGTPWTIWTNYQDFTFNSTTSDAVSVFFIALEKDATYLTADEIEITLQNTNTTYSLTWQAVVLVV